MRVKDKKEFRSLRKSLYLYTNLYVRTMLVEVISKYLLTNKRLVVPNLGTFIVKTAGESVLFSNLMKGDDGVLRHLLVEQGISELEAAGLIDRFVFEVNYRLQNGGVCLISGFGRLVAGANGSVMFEYNAAAQGENLEGDMPARKAAEKSAAVKPVVETKVETKVEEKVEERPQPVEQEVVKPVVEEQKRELKPKDTAEAARKVRPEKYTKGLRYGKGNKIVTGRESATSRRSNKGDLIIKIAIFVALLAIAALLYGLYNDWQAGRLFSSDEPSLPSVTTETTETVFEDAPEQIGEMRNPDLDYITPKQ